MERVSRGLRVCGALAVAFLTLGAASAQAYIYRATRRRFTLPPRRSQGT
ncbi:MAG: hypothetical protein ACRDNK_19380 [Solirubrobacteraceae bacterium]